LLELHEIAASDVPDLLRASQSSPPRPRAERAGFYLPAKRDQRSSQPLDSRFRGNDEKLRGVAENLAFRAREHLAEARRQRDAIPKDARSALLTTALAEVYIRRLARARYNLFNARWSMTRPAVVRLTILAALGHY
jgi:phytoene/squalene synthetase